MKNIAIILFAGILFSCEQKIDLSSKMKDSEPRLAVDAFINNLPQKQLIVLSGTQKFFDNESKTLISGADVALTDLTSGDVFKFTEASLGHFVSPIDGNVMLTVGHEYSLAIKHNGENYVAYSKVNRIVPIDSIKFEEAEELNGTKKPGKYQAEYFATDAKGQGDRYWTRFYRNGIRNTQPETINVSYDGSLGPNTPTDNTVFILPVRRNINQLGEREDESRFYVASERLKVEMYSISEEAAFFLQSLANIASQGSSDSFGALFSQPPYSLKTNIQNTNENGPKAVGYFSTSAVSVLETIVPFDVRLSK